MNSGDVDDVKQPMADLLAALDMRLSQGKGLNSDEEPNLPPDQLQLFRLAREGLLRLEKTWPRADPNAEPIDTPVVNPLTGAGQLGKFRIQRELGRGGGGIVFLATDSETGREVALKLPRLEALLDPSLRNRFIQEARFAIGLDHPGLAQVYEAGEIGAVCYIASAYSGETTLSDWIDKQREPVNVRTAVALVAAVARAVDYLHEHHILHRDIKPSNILLAPPRPGAAPDPELAPAGNPRLTDFGLAKLFETKLPESMDVGTTGGLVLGTAEYMAPEQVHGQPEHLGRPTDVYALGAVLYELIAGQPPFHGRNKFDTLRRALADQPRNLRQLRKDVPRNIESVCLKCLEKDPHHRYATAGQLADDLQRCLAGERPLARRPPLYRRAWRWARRRPVAAAGLAVVAGLLPSVLVMWLGIGYYDRAVRAEEQRRLDAVWQERAKAIELCDRGDIGTGLLWFARALGTAPDSAADLHKLLRFDLGAWHTHVPILNATLTHPARVSKVQFSPDGRYVLTTCMDNQARLWDCDSGQLAGPLLAHPALILKARFDGDGHRVRTLCNDGIIRTFSTSSCQLLQADAAQCAQRVLGQDSAPRASDLLWEFELGRPPPRPLTDTGVLWQLQSNPNHQTVLTANWGNDVRLWNADRATPIGEPLGHGADIYDASFSPDGTYVATAGGDRRVRFWNTEHQKEIKQPLEHSSPVQSMAFDPQGKLLAAGGSDSVTLWDLATRKSLVNMPKQNLVRCLAFSHDGRMLASGHGDTEIRLWSMPASAPALLVHPLANAATDAEHHQARRMPKGFNGVLAVALDSEGKRIFSGGVDNAVRQWDANSGSCDQVLARHRDVVCRLAVHPNGRTLLTASADNSIRQWDLANGQEVAPALSCQYPIGAAVYSPDGTLIATGALATDKVRLWNSATGKCLEEYGPFDSALDLAFSPDGNLLIVGCANCVAKISRISGEIKRAPLPNIVFAVAFDPKGHGFVTGNADGDLRWWNVNSLDCQERLAAHSHSIHRTVFSSKGDLLATVGWDERLMFWETTRRRSIGPPTQLAGSGRSAEFHPDGTRIIVGNRNGTIQWVSTPQPINGSRRQVLRWVQVITGTEIGVDDLPITLDADTWQRRRQELEVDRGYPI